MTKHLSDLRLLILGIVAGQCRNGVRPCRAKNVMYCGEKQYGIVLRTWTTTKEHCPLFCYSYQWTVKLENSLHTDHDIRLHVTGRVRNCVPQIPFDGQVAIPGLSSKCPGMAVPLNSTE